MVVRFGDTLGSLRSYSGLHGNADEWCEDEWHGDYEGAPEDGSAWLGGGDGNRVGRGGSWFLLADSCRSARRIKRGPSLRFVDIGFRILRISGVPLPGRKV